MKLKKNELANILAEVEQEISTLLKSEGEALRKAKGDGSDEPPGDGGSAPADDTAPGGAPEGSAPPMEGSPEGSAPPPGPEGAPPGMEGSPEGSADPAMGGGPIDPEALKAEYMQLPPEELKMHYMAAKEAMLQVTGSFGGASPGPGAPPGPETSAGPAPGGPGPGAPPPGPPGAPALKAEVPSSMKSNPANGGTQSAAVPDAIKKSEARIVDLEQQVDLMAKALELTLATPVRKAITQVSHIPKTDESKPASTELSKSEIQSKIRSAMSGGKLNKAEKDQLFSYTLGNLGFDQIAGILDKK